MAQGTGTGHRKQAGTTGTAGTGHRHRAQGTGHRAQHRAQPQQLHTPKVKLHTPKVKPHTTLIHKQLQQTLATCKSRKHKPRPRHTQTHHSNQKPLQNTAPGPMGKKHFGKNTTFMKNFAFLWQGLPFMVVFKSGKSALYLDVWGVLGYPSKRAQKLFSKKKFFGEKIKPK